MYQAINNYLIAKRLGETTTESGIIVGDTKGLTVELIVTDTTELTKELQDKHIIVENRVANRELPLKDGTQYVSVPLEDVIAVV